ncbi:MAG: hypothetical protein K8W52_16195 [Deltaproteobacteria bacterium]|nr:hypothetical protein [Deltaproteobacteria bacterium]
MANSLTDTPPDDHATTLFDSERPGLRQTADHAALRAVADPALGADIATQVLSIALARRGGRATLALAARLAADRIARPPWLPALIAGLTERPRGEIWPGLILAIDDGVPGAVAALVATGGPAPARFLAELADPRARLLGAAVGDPSCLEGAGRAILSALDRGRGGILTRADRLAALERERALVDMARQVVRQP